MRRTASMSWYHYFWQMVSIMCTKSMVLFWFGVHESWWTLCDVCLTKHTQIPIWPEYKSGPNLPILSNFVKFVLSCILIIFNYILYFTVSNSNCTHCHITVNFHEGHGHSNHQQLNRLLNSWFNLTTKKHQWHASLAICEDNPLATDGFTS